MADRPLRNVGTLEERDTDTMHLRSDRVTTWAIPHGRSVLAALMIFTGGCIAPEVSSERPDLMAIPDGSYGGPDAFCDLARAPQLRIVVQNQGQGNAPASITRVVFSPGGTTDIPTPPLSAGQRITLTPVSIPAVCFDPDCDFKILVDSRSLVEEAGEDNNVADGRCFQP